MIRLLYKESYIVACGHREIRVHLERYHLQSKDARSNMQTVKNPYAHVYLSICNGNTCWAKTRGTWFPVPRMNNIIDTDDLDSLLLWSRMLRVPFRFSAYCVLYVRTTTQMRYWIVSKTVIGCNTWSFQPLNLHITLVCVSGHGLWIELDCAAMFSVWS